MNKQEAVETKAVTWGRVHGYTIPSELTEWLGKWAPDRDLVPGVYNMIFHVARTTNMVPYLLDEKVKDKPWYWNQFVRQIVETYIVPINYGNECRSARIIANFSFLRTETRGQIVVWKAPEGLIRDRYEELVEAGVIQKSGTLYKLDDDIHRVFGLDISFRRDQQIQEELEFVGGPTTVSAIKEAYVKSLKEQSKGNYDPITIASYS